jgi:hypothetical protein
MPKAEQLSKMLTGQIDIPSNMAEMLKYTDLMFLEADNDYRAKNFSPELAQVFIQLTQNFMTTWRLYEVINHFAPLTDDQLKRTKYAKVKTIEVLKALKEIQKNQEEAYRPEPPQFTPGGPGKSIVPATNNPSPNIPSPNIPSPFNGSPYTPEPPQFTPSPFNSSFGNAYPTMSGFHMPTMPTMNIPPVNQPLNSPPQIPAPTSYNAPTYNQYNQ